MEELPFLLGRNDDSSLKTWHFLLAVMIFGIVGIVALRDILFYTFLPMIGADMPLVLPIIYAFPQFCQA